MQVIVDGVLTSYDTYGENGPVVVLLHGWGDKAAGLAGLAEVLAQDHRVIAPDLPGFGATANPPGDWGLDDYAQFVRTFLQKIDIGGVTAFVGHSNGGAILVRGIASGVLDADRVVLLASAGIRSTYKGRNLALRILAKIGKVLVWPMPAALKKRLRKKVYQTIGSDMFVAEDLQETFKKVVTDDVQADAAKLTMPVLLVYGQNDDATPVSYARIFERRMPNAHLHIVPNAGHFVHIDQKQTVEALVREFLQ